MNNLISTHSSLPPYQQELQQRCRHPSGEFVPFPEEAIEQSIPCRFKAQVRQYPDRLAVKTRLGQVTYHQLNALANASARAILATRPWVAEPVAILLERGIPAIAAMLGVLKAGKFYVPLDPSQAPIQLAQMVQDAQVSLILTDSRNAPLAEELAQPGIEIINVAGLPDDQGGENPDLALSPDSWAYIVYTSGSTGEPKGVALSHRNVLHKIRHHTNDFHLCRQDRLSHLSSMSLGPSQRDVFAALLNGALLCSFNVPEEGIANLASWLNEEAITFFHSSATVFRQLAPLAAGQGGFPSIRAIRVGGEQCSQRDVELYRQHFSPECIFINVLSGTESGTVRVYYLDHQTEIPVERVPVGYATADTEVQLLDEAGNPLDFNEIGEIAIRSRYLPDGYWRRPALTAAKFLPDPDGGDQRIYLTGDLGLMRPDGCLLHLGRKDLEVKLRGYRIDLAGIENALLNLEQVKEAVVIVREDRPGDPRLVAYLSAMAEPAPTTSALRQALLRKLSPHMVPAVFVLLAQLPKTRSGKPDRQALAAPGTERPSLDSPYLSPGSPIEKALVEIWQEALGLDLVGIKDDFLDLGGNSLLAGRVVARVIQRFGVKLPLRVLLDAPTVADMALALLEKLADDAGDERLATLLAQLED